MASPELVDLANQILVKNRVRIVDELDIRPILDDLRQAGIINEEDEEWIVNGETRKEKVRNLLNKLELRKYHPQALQEFLNSIKKHQPWIHQSLLNSPQTGVPLQQRIKDKYAQKKALCMKHPWATERSTHLPHDLYTNLKLINHRESAMHRNTFNDYSSFQEFCRNDLQSVHYKDLFENGTTGTRVLIEGDPGIGKTTLCYKLIHDYSRSNVAEDERYYVHDLLFAFVIELRHFRGSIRETLKQSLSLSEQELDELWRMIQANPGKCLFILDGLDEITRLFPAEIRGLIEGHLLGDCLVLATCRNNLANAFSGFHREVVNVGFLPEQASEYVQKYFTHVQAAGADINVEKAVQFLETEAEMLGDLLQTPLNCLLLCLWLEEFLMSSNQNQPVLQGKRMTTTGFYEMVVRSILKRYCEKKNLPLRRGNIPTDLKETLVKFQRLALFGVLKEKYTFTVDDLNSHQINEDDEVLSLGVLSREYSVGTLEEEDDVSYSFPHRSIQDFFAAKGVLSMPEAFKTLLLVYFGQLWKTHEHICLFLFGVLKEDLLLKWFLCCTLAHSPNEEGRQHSESEEGRHHSPREESGQHEENMRTIHAGLQEAKHKIGRLECVPEASEEFQSSISLGQIKDCVDHYKPVDWIWERNKTGKLSDTFCHCLRWMYEIALDEKPIDTSLLSEMISYLANLSDSKVPDWAVFTQCSPEIQTLIVRLWNHCSSFPEAKGHFYIQVSRMRDKVWSMLFKLGGLCMQDLELGYSSSEHLLDVLENLGPQMHHLEKLTFSCHSQIPWQRQNDQTLRKEVCHRKAVKTRIGQMTSLKSILLSSRQLGSCIGFLPENIQLEEVAIMALNWSQDETQEIVQEALSCQMKKLTLHQRNVTTVSSTGYVLQAIKHLRTRTNRCLREIHLQGFRLTLQEEELLFKLQLHFKNKNINLRLTDSQLVVQTVETVNELKQCLLFCNPDERLIAHRIPSLGEGVFSDVDGCLALFQISEQLDWSAIGQKMAKKLLQVALTSNAVYPVSDRSRPPIEPQAGCSSWDEHTLDERLDPTPAEATNAQAKTKPKPNPQGKGQGKGKGKGKGNKNNTISCSRFPLNRRPRSAFPSIRTNFRAVQSPNAQGPNGGGQVANHRRPAANQRNQNQAQNHSVTMAHIRRAIREALINSKDTQ